MSKKEIRKFLENVVTRIDEEKKEAKKAEELRKLEEAKKVEAENTRIQFIKESIANVLRDRNWDSLTLEEAEAIVADIKKVINEI